MGVGRGALAPVTLQLLEGRPAFGRCVNGFVGREGVAEGRGVGLELGDMRFTKFEDFGQCGQVVGEMFQQLRAAAVVVGKVVALGHDSLLW